MLKLLLCLSLLLLSQYSFAEVPDDVARREWDNFKTKYNRRYQGPVNASKFSTFKKNLNQIEELNGKNKTVNGDTPYGVTQFSDLTAQEFKTTYLTFKHGSKGGKTITTTPNPDGDDINVPPNLDWREKGAVSAVKDQGQCGSCWAFTVVEALESAIFLNHGVLPELSTQQVTSCSVENSGCQGGDVTSAYGYMEDHGVQSAESYPYTSGSGFKGECTYNENQVVAHIAGFKYSVPSCASTGDLTCVRQKEQEQEIKKQLVLFGPASVCINADTWQNYTGGVLAASTCASTWQAMDHCAQLVGYATPKSGSPYWIVKNQWGEGFGEKGYIKLEMGGNTCGVDNLVTHVNDPTYTNQPPGPSPTPSTTPSTTP